VYDAIASMPDDGTGHDATAAGDGAFDPFRFEVEVPVAPGDAPADPGSGDPVLAELPGDASPDTDSGPGSPEVFVTIPPGFKGVAGRLTTGTSAHPEHPAGRKVDLVLAGGDGKIDVLSSSETDADGIFRIAFPEAFVPVDGQDLRIETISEGDTVRASYTGILTDLDPAASVANGMESSFPALTFRQKALLADFVRAVAAAVPGPAPKAERLAAFGGGLSALLAPASRSSTADPVRGLSALLTPASRSSAADPVREYFLSIEQFKEELALFCATTDFSKADVTSFLERFESFVPGFLATDAFLDAAATPTASLFGLQKAEFDQDIVFFLMMIADLADDNLDPALSKEKAVNSVRAYCGLMLRSVPPLVLWGPEMAYETTVAASADIEVPLDVPVAEEDLAEAGESSPQDASIKFVFVHPMAEEAAHMLERAKEYCAWERMESWPCEVDKARGLSFTCPPGDGNCCGDCDCYGASDGCVFLTGCHECMIESPLSFACYSADEVKRGMQFAVPLSNAFVGILVDAGDRDLLYDVDGASWFAVDLYYDGVLVATTKKPYDMGPMYVGPPIDNPNIFIGVTDFLFLNVLNGLGKLYAPEVLEQIRLIVGLPSEAHDHEHHSYFFESRGDPFNGAMLVWRLSIADGGAALNGIRDVTSPGCDPIAQPLDAISQPHYMKGAMPADLDAFADAGNPGVLNSHELRAVLTLTDGSQRESILPIPAPAPGLVCPGCDSGSPPAASSFAPTDSDCKALLGEEYALQGTTQMKRIRNRLMGDLLDLAGGQLVSGLAESALSGLDHLSLANGLRTMSLKVNSLFKSPVINEWVNSTFNRIGSFLEGPASTQVWGVARKFLSDCLSGVVDKLASGMAPNADLAEDVPGWISTAEEYAHWKADVDNCREVLCAWSSGNLRILRQSMKVHGDAAMWAMDVIDRLVDWVTIGADTGEYADFLRGKAAVTAAGGAAVGRLNELGMMAKALAMTSKAAAAAYSMFVIGRKVELGEDVISTTGAFRSVGGPCGDPDYAIY